MALYNVGGHYFAGKGVELSFEKAAEYYRKAADQGFPPAQVSSTQCVWAAMFKWLDLGWARSVSVTSQYHA